MAYVESAKRPRGQIRTPHDAHSDYQSVALVIERCSQL